MTGVYAAPWILPMAAPPIRDGAVAVAAGRIAAVGPVSDIRVAYPEATTVTCRGVLMPALVNAHIHLELSALTDVERPAEGQPMSDWIEDLIRQREIRQFGADEKQRHVGRAFEDQYRDGVALMADIGNDPDWQNPGGFPEVMHFREFLAPTAAAVEAVSAIITALPDFVASTAHAPYSTAPGLIRTLHRRARKLASVFSVHVAESAAEVEFIASGAGSFRSFLERRGAWDGTFTANCSCPSGVITYLDRLGVLDEWTLCVHCVHVTDVEIGMLADRGCRVCVCPGSNRFLRVGAAPVARMLANGLLPAIGTDSSASNERLDLWREMQLLREDDLELQPEDILRMATLGGARALHRDDDFGSLAVGRSAYFLNVAGGEIERAGTAFELQDVLTGGGRPQEVRWVGCARKSRPVDCG